jgi:phage tail sheath protein FI
MANPKSPGVFLQEIPKLPASVAEVATAVPAFIGATETIGGTAADLLYKPVRISSLLEYEAIFGGPKKEKFNISIDDDVNSNNDILSRTVTVDRADQQTLPDYLLYYSLRMFFANGGGNCWIVSTGKYEDVSIDENDYIKCINALEQIDEVTLLVFPDAVILDSTPGTYKYDDVAQAALAHCAKMQDRFAILDVPADSIHIDDITDYRERLGMADLKYGAAYMPYLKTSLGYEVDMAASKVVSITGGYIFSAGSTITANTTTLEELKAKHPSIYNSVIAQIQKYSITLPPSGAIAGIYARVDAERGVWKAPANVSLRAVTAPTLLITESQQDDLNIDPTAGKSINAIRSFTGKGTLVWGARTLAGNDNEWRYVPVRRFFNFAEESIKKATEFSVFEPNDANTWLRLKTMIENFLTNQWKQGALAGAKKEDAFYVSVGLGTTMTAQDILEGRLNIEIGMAVVRPAEFIILKFSHKLQES